MFLVKPSFRLLWAGLLFQVLVLTAAEPSPIMVPGPFAGGAAQITPDHGVSGEFGTWKVHYTVGPGGIRTGGGLRVQLPDAFHSGPRNSANCLQATRPEAPHYISARSDSGKVKLEVAVESETDRELVKHAKASLDGRNERYVFVVRVKVIEGGLDEGDHVTVVYGDTSQGSPGLRAGAIAHGPEPVLIAVDAAGDNRFRLLRSPPRLSGVPGQAVELLVHAPSQARLGQSFELRVALLDKQHNAASAVGEWDVAVITGGAKVPARLVRKAGQSAMKILVTPTAAKPLRIRVRDRASGRVGMGNPTDVLTRDPERWLLWGDLHSHTRFSWDGVGDDPFQYARAVTGLDFYSMSDHSLAPTPQGTRGLSAKNWKEYTSLTEAAHDPPGFITLHAYEASFGRPYGHHIVYFRDEPGPLIIPGETSLEELWGLLRQGQAVTIPHHTGKFPGGTDFRVHDARFRRNFEIFSGHGLSEVYDPGHPLSFEHSKFTSDARSLPAPTFAQDAWRMGLQLSTIASSDDHRAQPGQPHYGLVALHCKSRTRDGVFQALHDRHSYGTSGSKILLEFSLNGVPMGQSVRVVGAADLVIRALGTGVISQVEILRWLPGGQPFEVIRKWEPGVWDFEGRFQDEGFRPGAIYYARLRQAEPVREKLVMAWSSPIWTQAQ